MTGVQIPDEDIVFSSMFFSDGGTVWNTLGEDLDDDNVLDTGEDIIPNGVPGSGDPGQRGRDRSAGDRAPFTFDTGRDGFTAFRNANSEVGTVGIGTVWEYQTLGLCGAQTAIPDGDPTAGVPEQRCGDLEDWGRGSVHAEP